MQFVSDELFDGEGLELIQGSYTVFGTNGTHDLNGLITTGTGASPDTLTALADFSDHLPVFSDFSFVAVPEPSSTIALAVVGLAGAVVLNRRRKTIAP